MRLGQKGSVEREGWESGSVLCAERWPSDGGQWQFVADGEHRGGVVGVAVSDVRGRGMVGPSR